MSVTEIIQAFVATVAILVYVVIAYRADRRAVHYDRRLAHEHRYRMDSMRAVHEASMAQFQHGPRPAIFLPVTDPSTN